MLTFTFEHRAQRLLFDARLRLLSRVADDRNLDACVEHRRRRHRGSPISSPGR